MFSESQMNTDTSTQAEQKRHRATIVPDFELDRGAAEQPRSRSKQKPAQIDHEMMGEEVEIGRNAQRDQARRRGWSKIGNRTSARRGRDSCRCRNT